MKSELVFIKEEPYLQNLDKALKKFIPMFSAGEKIAIKTHLGEYGNLYYVRPPIIGKIVEILKSLKTKPFVFDSPTLYEGERANPKKYLETAKKNGFTAETIDCPIIISNEGDLVCKDLAEADGMIVVSHVKGHVDAGFGAAIKNLGMGGVTKNEKRRIHTESKPIIARKRECTGCGTCVEFCKNNAISIENNKVKIDYDKCYGCSICVDVCPNKVLGQKSKFDELLAKGANSVLKTFKKDKLLFVNLLIDIVKSCDCCKRSGPFLANNMGILIGKDIVAIDKASFDLIKKKTGKDIFKEVHYKSPEEHINYTAKLRMGSKEYSLKIS